MAHLEDHPAGRYEGAPARIAAPAVHPLKLTAEHRYSPRTTPQAGTVLKGIKERRLGLSTLPMQPFVVLLLPSHREPSSRRE
jgi:hypothetical protein